MVAAVQYRHPAGLHLSPVLREHGPFSAEIDAVFGPDLWRGSTCRNTSETGDRSLFRLRPERSRVTGWLRIKLAPPMRILEDKKNLISS